MTYTIIVEPEAFQDLKTIITYITKKDSKTKAHTFVSELKASIASHSELPMRCRRSLYLDQENTRDLIYKGYTAVFQVRDESIHILAIFRQKAY